MKKQLILILLTIVFTSLTAGAQELKVLEFRADMSMTDAVRYPKTDANGVNCALIRIGLVVPDAQFEGDIVSAEYKEGEWWVYMENGSNWITIKSKQYLPLRHEFEAVKSNVTYIMNVEKPQTAIEGPTGTLALVCNLERADVYIDGEKVSSTTRKFKQDLPEGKHEVEIRAVGFNNERQTVDIELRRTTTATINLKPAGSFQWEGTSYEMVKVEGGTFVMGSAEKPADKLNDFHYGQPQHEVTLRNYSIGKTEVTQALWEKVMGSNPSVHVGPNLPVENVTYDDCLDFISRLNALSGNHFRLPTEAEWEYAARERGKGKPDECSGGSASKVAQTVAVSAVGKLKANGLGIFDMSGNVAEWCSDWIHSYSKDSEVSPQGPDEGTQRVVRGGGAGQNEWRMHCASRSHRDPNEPSPVVGFRLAMDD